MKKLHILSRIARPLPLLLLLAAMSCTDDHFTVDPEVAGRSTIWETIQTTSNLSQFADILKSVQYSKTRGTTTRQTYADLLNHDQTFTVWAPADGTFDYEACKKLIASGSEGAYKVETELIRNCMARYTHLLSGDKVEEIKLFNDKSAIFNCASQMLKNQKIRTSNIGTSNGVVHIIDGAPEYLPNVYEFIESQAGLDSLWLFLKNYEELEFNENQSTKGPIVNGDITWADSVTNLTNRYFNVIGAYLNREDSSYAMVMPNNDAWTVGYNKIKGYYVYQPEYQQTIVSVDETGKETTETKTTSYTQEEIDSITRFYIDHTIARNLVFNTNEQYGHYHEDYPVVGACDSLKSTWGDTFEDPYSAALFDGKTPTQLSNGYAYIVDHYNYRPEDSWLFVEDFEAERFYESYSSCTPTSTRIYQNWSYMTDSTDISTVRDTVIQETVLRLAPSRATANSSVTIRLPQTLSTKYDIYAVMAYNTSANRPYQFRAYLNYHKNARTSTRQQLQAIEGVNGSGRNFVSKEPHVDEKGQFHFNDSVLVAQDFEFPVSYVGIDDAYVTLEIQSYMTSSQRTTFTNELLIDKIVLVPKEKSEE